MFREIRAYILFRHRAVLIVNVFGGPASLEPDGVIGNIYAEGIGFRHFLAGIG